jgi:hypothetical protein
VQRNFHWDFFLNLGGIGEEKKRMQLLIVIYACVLLWSVSESEAKKGASNRVSLGAFRTSNVKKSRILPPLSGPDKAEQKLTMINEMKERSVIKAEQRQHAIEMGKLKRENKKAKNISKKTARKDLEKLETIDQSSSNRKTEMGYEEDAKENVLGASIKKNGLRRLLLTKSLQAKQKE